MSHKKQVDDTIFTKNSGLVNKINLDYDFNTEYGDGDIPDIDKPNSSNAADKTTNNKLK
ncbi:hypothetical protein [Anaeromicropila populeti]|uniref:Uncharacterized protein n=1 Tax=Anaeromicropila populeti TaxID=37658 RepID=A0A1I6JI88_9FIRM|nr:hypothetical protein [Anaeromicropila populeti]SFR78748.1 hypothetical protein SAMN05661086_01718 [Anaeromicropila populeti]